MKPINRGFTLIEILLSMSVLIVGLVGILALFPVGLDATRKAIEDTTAAMIAESVYSSFRAATQHTSPGGKLAFFHDGIDSTANQYPKPSSLGFKKSVMYGKTFGIPGFRSVGATSTSDGTPINIYTSDTPPKINYECKATEERCFLGQEHSGAAYKFDVSVPDEDQGQLAQIFF